MPSIPCRGPAGTFVSPSLISGTYVITAMAKEPDGTWAGQMDVEIDSGGLFDLGDWRLRNAAPAGSSQSWSPARVRTIVLRLSRMPTSRLKPLLVAASYPKPTGPNSQQAPTISGSIRSSSDANALLDGELVVTDTKSGDTVKTVTIKHTGHSQQNSSQARMPRLNTFELDSIKEGEYLLSVSAIGYRSALLLLRVSDEGTFEILDGMGQNLAAPPLIEMEPQAELSSRNRINDEQTVSRQNFTGTQQAEFKGAIIEALPLGGLRRIDDLALLLPGVATAPESFTRTGPSIGPFIGTSGEYAINGLRPRQNSFTADGSDNNDEEVGARRQGFVAGLTQSVESVSDFQVITLLPDARFGRAIGGQVNVISKYGQSAFHGSAWGFLTGTPFRASDPFDGTVTDYPTALRQLIPVTANGRADGRPVRLDLGPTPVPGLIAQDGLAYTQNLEVDVNHITVGN